MSEQENLERREGDSNKIRWMPKWIVKIESTKTNVGVTVDDGCYLVLVRSEENGWQPTKWMPKEAVIFIYGQVAKLADAENLKLSKIDGSNPSLPKEYASLKSEVERLRKVVEAAKAIPHLNRNCIVYSECECGYEKFAEALAELEAGEKGKGA